MMLHTNELIEMILRTCYVLVPPFIHLRPLHALLWGFARYHTTGSTVCRRISGPGCWLAAFGRTALWAAPIFTYAALRYIELNVAWLGVCWRCEAFQWVFHAFFLYK